MIRTSVAGLAQQDGKYLMARRVSGGALGLKWELPGGKVRREESPQEALCREWQEELGLHIKVGKCLGQSAFNHKGTDFTLQLYTVEFLGGDLTLREHSEYGWFSPEAMNGLDLVDSDRTLLALLFEDIAPL